VDSDAQALEVRQDELASRHSFASINAAPSDSQQNVPSPATKRNSHKPVPEYIHYITSLYREFIYTVSV
jgi:hypothetical protein